MYAPCAVAVRPYFASCIIDSLTNCHWQIVVVAVAVAVEICGVYILWVFVIAPLLACATCATTAPHHSALAAPHTLQPNTEV